VKKIDWKRKSGKRTGTQGKRDSSKDRVSPERRRREIEQRKERWEKRKPSECEKALGWKKRGEKHADYRALDKRLRRGLANTSALEKVSRKVL